MRMPDAKVEITGNLADACRAYFSLSGDMELVQLYLQRMPAFYLNMVERMLERQAFWAAAVASYARCFNQGSRKAYARSVEIPAQFAPVHEYLLAFRNNNIAHLTRTPVSHATRLKLVVSAESTPRYQRDVQLFTIDLDPQADGVAELATLLQRQYSHLAERYRKRISELVAAYDDSTIRDMARRKQPLRVDDPEFRIGDG